MWVLIMTIVFAGNSGYAGVAGATVATQEFNNSATCRLAGAEWAKAQPSVKNHEKWYFYFGDCHARKANWLAMTRSDDTFVNSANCPLSTRI